MDRGAQAGIDRMNVAKSRATRAAPWVVPVLTIGIFALDLLAPLGLAISALYVIPLLLTFLSPRERDPLYFCIVATVLTWGDVLLKPVGLPMSYALFNRAIGMLIIWGVTIGLMRDKGTQHELMSERTERAHAEGLMIAAQEARAHADASAMGAIERESEASRELILSTLRLDGLIQSAMDAIVMIDQRQRIQLFNAAAEQMFGSPAKEAIGQPLDKFIPARFREAHREYVEGFGQSGVTSRRMGALGTITGLRASGEEFPIEASISHIAVEGKKFYTVILRDITERKRLQDEIRQERDFINAVLDTAGALVVVLNREGRILRFNRACEQATGYEAAEVAGRIVWDFLLVQEEIEPVKRVFQRLSGGETRSDHVNYWVGKHGGRKLISWSNTTMLSPSGAVDYVIAAGIDITTLKDTQEQLRRTERLAELGTLASGMAHEIGTPMNVIMGRAEHLMQRTSDEKTKKGLEIIVNQVERITKIMTQLLSMARRKPGERRATDLRRVIEDCLEVLQERLRKHRIRVEKEYRAHAGPAVVDPDQMSQVLLNLILNADHAMPDGGTLRLGLRSENDRIIMTIGDTGHGIPPEILPKIFTPFFTTKDVGKGTGLGLAVVHGIIEEHHGTIGVESEVGKGTVFTITLPLGER
jgi:PAS domain S-box-containing protein